MLGYGVRGVSGGLVRLLKDDAAMRGAAPSLAYLVLTGSCCTCNSLCASMLSPSSAGAPQRRSFGAVRPRRLRGILGTRRRYGHERSTRQRASFGCQLRAAASGASAVAGALHIRWGLTKAAGMCRTRYARSRAVQG